MMLSDGGLADIEFAAKAPIRFIESGPAGGVLAARLFGSQSSNRDLISFDMGGTTAKICLVDRGQPTLSNHFEAARVHRFKKGSGIPLKVPVIDMLEIGAGGGSIAHIDQLGLLKVGPESAGAAPGPACYGLGGTEPTVTDADLLLGCLNPDYFLGGRIRLDAPASTAVIAEKIASPLSLDLIRSTVGISELVNHQMASAIRLYVAERGQDFRTHDLVAYGGAGPVHAYRVAQLLGLKRIICPVGAGAASAFGFLLAPKAATHARTYSVLLDRINWDHLNALMEDLETVAQDAVTAMGVEAKDMRVVRIAELRVSGQGQVLAVNIRTGKLGPEDAPVIWRLFTDTYVRLFGQMPPGIPVECVTWRVRVSGAEPKIAPKLIPHLRELAHTTAVKGRRSAYFPEINEFCDATIYDRYTLSRGSSIRGPAIVEEVESTVVIGPNGVGLIDDYGNLIIDVDNAEIQTVRMVG
jgi:N-methylhydantoinase A